MRIRIQIKNIVKNYFMKRKKKKDCSKVKPIELVQIYFKILTKLQLRVPISNFLEFFCYF